jgi:hypothetical protein
MVDDADTIPNAPAYGKPVTRNMSGKQGAYVPAAHRNSSGYSGAAAERFSSWDPSAKPPPSKKNSEKDVLDLK